MTKKTVSPRLTEQAGKWYAKNWDNLNQGVQYALESYPEMYARTLAGMRGFFTAAELSLILDVQNGCFLAPQMAGQHLLANVEDGISLEHYDQKWKIDGETLIKKIRSRMILELAFLEVWANAFWAQESQDINLWVSGLAGNIKNELGSGRSQKRG